MYDIDRSILPSVIIVDIVDFELNISEWISRGDRDWKAQRNVGLEMRTSSKKLTDVKTSKYDVREIPSHVHYPK